MLGITLILIAVGALYSTLFVALLNKLVESVKERDFPPAGFAAMALIFMIGIALCLGGI